MKTTIAALAAAATIAAHGEGLDDLAWMSGSWVERKGGTVTEEHWLPHAGGLMIAVYRTVAEGKPTSFEFLRIEMRDGKPAYLSSPGGKPATEFRTAEQAATRIVFEDPTRDFPRRILYWREGELLAARIEGTINGQARSREWRFERMRGPM